MSGPNPGWNPDGTPNADSEANTDANTGPQTPQQPAQPSYGSLGQDYSGGQPGYAALTPPPPPSPPYGAVDPAQYGGPGQPSFPSQAQPSTRRKWLGYAILIVIIVVVVGGFVLFRDRMSSNVSDLGVSDCFQEPTETTDVKDVQLTPCNEPHDGEVFALVNHTAAAGTTYPVSSEFRDLVSDECLPALETYTARTYEEVYAAGLDVSYFYPSSSSWSDGDREVTCFIVKVDESQMTGSVRAGGATPAP
jgi:hypothetical protein